jgi:hypothetical protein
MYYHKEVSLSRKGLNLNGLLAKTIYRRNTVSLALREKFFQPPHVQGNIGFSGNSLLRFAPMPHYVFLNSGENSGEVVLY